MNDGFSIELSKDEFYVLLGHFGPATVLGMAHPFRGLLSDEIALATSKALQSLLGRNLVSIGDGEVLVDSALESVIQICAHPEHSLIVQLQRIGEAEQHFIIHFHGTTILKQVEFEPGLYRLTVIEDQNELLSWFVELLQLDSNHLGEGNPLSLDELLLFEARAMCIEDQRAEVCKRLEKAGFKEEQYTALVNTLTAPLTNASFALISNRDKLERQYVRGFAVLESEEYLWILHPLDDLDRRRVNIIPATSEMVWNRFETMLP
jgi:hypothetical protein